jgi:hypothetical protein
METARHDEVSEMATVREEKGRAMVMPHGRIPRVMETARRERDHAMRMDRAKSVHQFDFPGVTLSDRARAIARQSVCRGKKVTVRVKVDHVQTLQFKLSIRVVRWVPK